MKKILIALLSVLIFNQTISAATTELSKEEKKEIKTKLKTFKKEPEKYKSMVNNYTKSIKDRDVELENTKAELAQLKASTDKKMQECNDSLAALQNRLAEALKNGSGMAKLPAGESYGVQIGNYKFFDITKYFGSDKYLGNIEADGSHQYVVMYFTDPRNAEACTMDIKKLGVKDAFVTKYEDGKRVPFDINSLPK